MQVTPPSKPRSLRRAIARLSPFFARHRARLFAVIALAVLAAVVGALEPLVIKRLFDTFVSGSRLAEAGSVSGSGFAEAGMAMVLLVAMLLGAELCNVVIERQVFRVRVDVSYHLLRAAVERLHALPLSYHREHGVGGVITRIERGIAACMTAFADVIVQVLPALIYLGVSITVMLRLDPRLALVVIALAPLPALVGALASCEQVEREEGLLQRWTRVFARFNEVLTGITMIKSFAMEEREERRLLSAVDDANQVALRGVVKDSRNNGTKKGLIALARVAALGLGGLLVMRGSITIGTLMAFIAYVAGVLQPVQRLTGMYESVRRAGVTLDSLLSLLDTHQALTEDPAAHEVALRGDVRFRGVRFGYRPGIDVLNGVDIAVHQGETVALVGPGGTGKTTLMALLQRLYDPTEGAIEIDGHDLRQVKPSSLREQIGVVLQEATLLNDTVRDNIAFGRPEATREQIANAARAAHADDFIRALPDGYDTLVGERGCNLSAGERQRIAIARALLKDAPILVLDEATAGLDVETEGKVSKALQQLAKGKTTFVIANGPTPIPDIDRIFVLKDGAIAEAGKHEELMRNDGYYAWLVRKQAPLRQVASAAS